MECEIVKIKGTWRDVADLARTTIGMDSGKKEPTEKWKYKMLKCEHSPIREITVRAKFTDIPYWVVMHLVRHKIGIEHYVSTQRTDRTNINRNELPQGSLVTYEFVATLQAVISISRKRLCSCAAEETRNAWRLFLGKLFLEIPEMEGVCVPECIYRGHCTEYKTCGYAKTAKYHREVDEYQCLV